MSDDKAFTLATSNFHTIFMFSHNQGLDPQASEEASPTLRSGGNGVAVAFSFDSLASNSMKSNNPNSGCRKVDKSKTLDTSALNPNANQGGMAIMSQLVRRLTPTECERLQGFPDGWTDGQADSHRYKQMGNAVAVPVVQWIIDRLVK